MGVMNRFMNFLGLQEEEEVVEREVLASQDEPVEATPFDHRKNQKKCKYRQHSFTEER
ncbi:hypothetical protein PVOR_11394 [Paenibacillus vortex V453]|uniref:Uncharacterized protein n=1 Tax=Paenibacillus vortex V453 TaxID=715225 RepID=A0A2R9SXH1_9BACL|nr:hypothetical protein PVOR_11394 [Paenibacillus vortex V453]